MHPVDLIADGAIFHSYFPSLLERVAVDEHDRRPAAGIGETRSPDVTGRIVG
jgi:hypothetical protein